MKDIICKICSNGCKLHAEVKDGIYAISGYKCNKGYKFLQKRITKKDPLAQFNNKKSFKKVDTDLSTLATLWNCTFQKELTDIMIQGSPERSLFRTVFEDLKGQRYIIEEISKKNINDRERISKRVFKLKKKGLPTIIYMKGKKGKYIQKYKGKYWMCQKFLPNTPLNRTTYWNEADKGVEVANFLLKLHKLSISFKKKKGDFFSLEVYINKLVKSIKKENKEVYRKVKSLYELLAEHLFPVYESFPETFSHGDSHPLNMIWDKEHMTAVIDWEFSGFKPRVYDVSLIIGCVGSEDETALNSGFLNSFLSKLKESKYLTPKEWHYLPLFTVAQRFAWLSEWLRRNDEEMISFELFYMHHILQWNPSI